MFGLAALYRLSSVKSLYFLRKSFEFQQFFVGGFSGTKCTTNTRLRGTSTLTRPSVPNNGSLWYIMNLQKEYYTWLNTLETNVIKGQIRSLSKAIEGKYIWYCTAVQYAQQCRGSWYRIVITTIWDNYPLMREFHMYCMISIQTQARITFGRYP